MHSVYFSHQPYSTLQLVVVALVLLAPVILALVLAPVIIALIGLSSRCPAEGSVETQMERDPRKWSKMSELFERMPHGPP